MPAADSIASRKERLPGRVFQTKDVGQKGSLHWRSEAVTLRQQSDNPFKIAFIELIRKSRLRLRRLRRPWTIVRRMKLFVRLLGNRTETVPVPEGSTLEEAMNQLANGEGPFEPAWIRLANNHLIRRDQIVEMWPGGTYD